MAESAEKFLEKVEQFIAKHEIAPSTFGRIAMADPSFVFKLRQGRSPSLDVFDKVSALMAQPALIKKLLKQDIE
jgi:hypothetical protein